MCTQKFVDGFDVFTRQICEKIRNDRIVLKIRPSWIEINEYGRAGRSLSFSDNTQNFKHLKIETAVAVRRNRKENTSCSCGNYWLLALQKHVKNGEEKA
jgi:hypothetical protein